jgi:hypothetical protein
MANDVEPVDFVRARYAELAEVLEKWGFSVMPPSAWSDLASPDPPTGHLELYGEAEFGSIRLKFKITEVWQLGEADLAATKREGASLVNYHYHGQFGDHAALRFCLFEEGHPDMPVHRHPFGVSTAEPYDLVSPSAAIEEFFTEGYLYLGGQPE